MNIVLDSVQHSLNYTFFLSSSIVIKKLWYGIEKLKMSINVGINGFGRIGR